MHNLRITANHAAAYNSKSLRSHLLIFLRFHVLIGTVITFISRLSILNWNNLSQSSQKYVKPFWWRIEKKQVLICFSFQRSINGESHWEMSVNWIFLNYKSWMPIQTMTLQQAWPGTKSCEGCEYQKARKKTRGLPPLLQHRNPLPPQWSWEEAQLFSLLFSSLTLDLLQLLMTLFCLHS